MIAAPIARGLRRIGPQRLASACALALVVSVGLAVIWPLPRGVMPLSADHPVHLTRAWLYGQVIAGGELRGWSPLWFFGMPVGELYPPLGDLIVLGFRGLTLGRLSWESAYAAMVSVVFILQGVAMVHAGGTVGRAWARRSQRPGLAAIAGAAVGAIAGVLTLVDAGTYREGGWIYTILYGVWPQALATALAVLCLSAAARARLSVGSGDASRELAWAGLFGGLALLAHPMSLPSLALAAGLGFFLLPGRGVGETSRESRSEKTGDCERYAHIAHSNYNPSEVPSWPKRAICAIRAHASERAAVAADLVLVAGLAFALAAWWLLPMLAHRGWMASYGWLHDPLAALAEGAARGEWTTHMPSAVGYAVWLGLAIVLLRGPALARLLGIWGLVQWLLASRDAFWELRLDHLSAGFTHIQFQRLLIAAKPGLFLLAGIGLVGLAAAIVRLWGSRLRSHLRLPLVLSLGGSLVLLAGGVVHGSAAAIARHRVGEVPTARFSSGGGERSGGDETGREAAYDQLLTWLGARWREREPGDFYRVAFHAGRNHHWFMDSPLRTATPTYKVGFTPGDNFVHKPESAGPALLLDRLGVRYLVRADGRPRPATIAHFGPFVVDRREASAAVGHLEGPGALEVVDAAGLSGLVAGGSPTLRLRISGAGEGSRLVLHVAGYPRWELRQGGALLPWIEVPVLPQGGGAFAGAATVDDRRRGLLRGGKAGGNDGSEPTLIAAAVSDGEVTLEYVRWRAVDRLGLVLSLGGVLGLGLGFGFGLGGRRRGRWLERWRGRWRAGLGPWAPLGLQLALGAALVAGLGLRWSRGAAAESGLASAWLTRGSGAAVPPNAAAVGPFKADMLIRPAIVVTSEAALLFPGVALAELGGIRGYVAVDDDIRSRRGRHRLAIDWRPAGAREWSAWRTFEVPHRPGRVMVDLNAREVAAEVIDLRLRVVSGGGSGEEARARVGLNLELGAPVAPVEPGGRGGGRGEVRR